MSTDKPASGDRLITCTALFELVELITRSGRDRSVKRSLDGLARASTYCWLTSRPDRFEHFDT